MLPEPRNSEENDFLKIFGTTHWFFLGLTDRETEGRWVWSSDGTPVTWTLWKSGEPNGGRWENCVAADKKWTSQHCYQHHDAEITLICEKTRKYAIYHLTKQTHE